MQHLDDLAGLAVEDPDEVERRMEFFEQFQEPKSLLGERLYGSTTRDMLFDSSIPLFILPPTHHE